MFNKKTGDEIPDMYMPSKTPSRESLLRMRRDLDSIISKNNVIEEKCSFRFYITMRERIEALADMVHSSE